MLKDWFGRVWKVAALAPQRTAQGPPSVERIVAEASLSFLGLGVVPPTPSWGSMIDDGRLYLEQAPHVAAFPGLAILVTVLGLNFLGDGLRDALDVKGSS